jgi:hypothetical protein
MQRSMRLRWEGGPRQGDPAHMGKISSKSTEPDHGEKCVHKENRFTQEVHFGVRLSTGSHELIADIT